MFHLVRESMSEQEALELKLAIVNLDAKKEFCFWFYDQCHALNSTEPITCASVGKYRPRGSRVRVEYALAASVWGVLSSLHAVIDSIPYLYAAFVAAKPKSKLDSFLADIDESDFKSKLKDLIDSSDFLALKEIVNQSKHRHCFVVAYFELDFWVELYQPLSENGNYFTAGVAPIFKRPSESHLKARGWEESVGQYWSVVRVDELVVYLFDNLHRKFIEVLVELGNCIEGYYMNRQKTDTKA